LQQSVHRSPKDVAVTRTLPCPRLDRTLSFPDQPRSARQMQFRAKVFLTAPTARTPKIGARMRKHKPIKHQMTNKHSTPKQANASARKSNPKWRKKLSRRTSTLLAAGATIVAIIGGLFSIATQLTSHPRNTVGAAIDNMTVQQDVPFSDWFYYHGTGRDPRLSSPSGWPTGHTLGILVLIQVRLAGYSSDLYSAQISLVAPHTQQRIISLDSTGTWCDNIVPSVNNDGFVLACWIGQPIFDPRFSVQAQVFNAGDESYYSNGYKSIPDMETLAVSQSRSITTTPYSGPVKIVLAPGRNNTHDFMFTGVPANN
jgi:hypothetical protein